MIRKGPGGRPPQVPAPRGGGAGTRLRLFVAAEVPEKISHEVHQAVEPLRLAAPGLRWTEPGGWHLTLAFLGGVEPGVLGSVAEGVAEVSAAAHPCTLRLTGTAGAFASGVLYAGLREAPLLAETARALRARLLERDEGVDAGTLPFRPHLTLARSRQGQRLLPQLAGRYEGPQSAWTVRRVVIMRSQLGLGGPRYQTLSDWAFGG